MNYFKEFRVVLLYSLHYQSYQNSLVIRYYINKRFGATSTYKILTRIISNGLEPSFCIHYIINLINSLVVRYLINKRFGETSKKCPLFPPFLLVNLIYQVGLCNLLRHFVDTLLKSIFHMEECIFLKENIN